MNEINWTNWNGGVSFMLGLKSGVYSRLENYGTSCRVSITHGARTLAEMEDAANIEQARQWAEEQARTLEIIR